MFKKKVFNVVGMLAKLIFMFFQAQDFSFVCFLVLHILAVSLHYAICFINFEVLKKFANNKIQIWKEK